MRKFIERNENKTMNKKMSKRQKDMKSKLMAAICMLLVSSIMMVSTTYAWFTLSTAPEVTGITTAVGANGNLEMALLNAETYADLTKISSAVGDSMDSGTKTTAQANVTWGNLVDLTDPSTYGLQQITLNPSALNVNKDESGKDKNEIATSNPLKTPAYGADGRVTKLVADAFPATFASNGFSNENGYGARAVGTASSMTPRQLAYRTLKQTAVSNSSGAKSDASGSLNTNGAVLAGIAIKKANDSNATYTRDEVKALYNTVLKLQSAVGKIETALKNYVAAHNIAKNATNYESTRDVILGKSITELYTECTGNSASYNAPEGFTEAVKKLYGNDVNGTTGTVNDVNDAVSGLKILLYNGETENDTQSFTWTQISFYMDKILKTSEMKMNDEKLDDIIAGSKDDAEQAKKQAFNNVVSQLLSGKGIQLTMETGSGAYADIADFCGDYSASIVLPSDAVIKDMSVGGVGATMSTKTTVDAGAYLTQMNNNLKSYNAVEGETVVNAITDYYGYIIDLAFRTNAANSNLELQTDAINRIYADGKNEDVMGGGSSMTFTSDDTTFGIPNVKALMKHIRAVFFDPDTGTIYAEARLDTDNATVDGNAVTAGLKVYSKTEWKDYQGFTAAATAPATTPETQNDVDEQVQAQDGDNVPENAAGSTDNAIGNDSTSTATTSNVANTLVALEQNQAKKVSVLVYLDGETISNADVAATASTSMTGSMNLQFSSSADLKPMVYTDLKDGQGTASDKQIRSLKTVTVDSSAASYTSFGGYVYTSGENTRVGVILNGVGENEEVYLKVGTGNAMKASTEVYNGYNVYYVTAEGANEDTAVVVYKTMPTAAPEGGGQ